ncbi:MAG: hypothetical protein M3O46_19940 [Myxococcota bacterium]|nr:hypothetical protein [Myxococcota bacterium]
MSSAALVKAREHLSRMHARVQSLKGKGEEAVGETIAAVEVVGGAAAAGFIDEKWGTDDGSGIKMAHLHGVPANLLLGAGGKLVTFMGIAGKQSQHAHDVSNGFLAGYGYHLGIAAAKKAATV